MSSSAAMDRAVSTQPLLTGAWVVANPLLKQ
jgi:hypothetical protein